MQVTAGPPTCSVSTSPNSPLPLSHPSSSNSSDTTSISTSSLSSSSASSSGIWSLGECSLVFCCSLQNLHWVFGYGLQCFWDQKIFLETFLFWKVTISSTASVFADFQTLKIWVPPNLPCFKGFFEKFYILSSSARSFLPNFLHPEVFKTALWISSENFFSHHSWWHGENNMRLLPCKILSPAHFFSHSFQLWITVCPLLKVINPLSRSPHRRLHLPAWNW